MIVFNSNSDIQKVMEQLEEIGIVPFSDTTTPFREFCTKHKTSLKSQIIQGYTEHKQEGYLYFLYDNDKYSRKDAAKVVSKITNF